MRGMRGPSLPAFAKKLPVPDPEWGMQRLWLRLFDTSLVTGHSILEIAPENFCERNFATKKMARLTQGAAANARKAAL